MHSLFLKFAKSLGPVFVGLCSSWCWPPWVPCTALGLSWHGWVPQAQLLDTFTQVGLWLLVKEGFPCKHWKGFSAYSKIRKYNLKTKNFWNTIGFVHQVKILKADGHSGLQMGLQVFPLSFHHPWLMRDLRMSIVEVQILFEFCLNFCWRQHLHFSESRIKSLSSSRSNSSLGEERKDEAKST